MPVKGRHAAPPERAPPRPMAFTPLFLLISITISSRFAASFGSPDSQNLLKFKGSLSNASALAKWSNMTEPCNGGVSNWKGVTCVGDSVGGLKLKNMGLTGKIDVQTLQTFPTLRTLDFMKNNFDGPLPNFTKLTALRSIYLSDNHFSGEIPNNAFQGMTRLRKLFLANNQFNGAIPSSLTNLQRLSELGLEGNKFIGKLPNFQEKFAYFNVSNNELEGSIPQSLSAVNSTSFLGNKGLCGQPLGKSCESKPPVDESKKPSVLIIVLVAIVVAIAIAAIVGAALVLFNRRKRASTSLEGAPSPLPPDHRKKAAIKEQRQGQQAEHPTNSKKTEMAKLSFVRDDRERFELHDLLKASAQILGGGCFGSSYKAALLTGPTMVVKRFKQMNSIGREDFIEHMRRLGRLMHPNLLPLVAYYYRKEEKLLITDYIEKGNLAVHLHGPQASMDWPTRLKITKGVGRGLAYLCKELPSLVAAHGHLKCSNILLDQSNEPLLTDYGLIPVINSEAHQLMVAYKSPEYLQATRITKKTDVWSLGMLIMELLTGKNPASNQEEDLSSWVSSIPEEEWRSKVFDKKMKGSGKSEGEIVKLMKIGLSCSEGDVEKRLELKEAVDRINEVKENDM